MNLEVKNENYIENLNWRYATKQFDPSKKISETTEKKLLESLKLSASSYGLQPYEILIVKDEEVRNQLKAAAWNQSQITDSSFLIIFANYRKITSQHLEDYLNNISETRNIPREKLKGMEDMISNTVLSFGEQQQQIWASKQTYIALGNLLSAAAEFRVDTCPMEGFDNREFDKILGLEKKNLTTSVIAAVGIRSSEDAMQHLEKVRKNDSELFHTI